MADARRTLLERLIDDAGMFPPASLSASEAAGLHHRHRNGPDGWVLGRFLCPASRLEELLPHIPESDPGGMWGLGVIADAPEATETLAKWLEVPPVGARVEAVEAPVWTDVLGPLAAEIVDRSLELYLQVPGDEPDLAGLLDSFPSAHPGATPKIRCGGPRAESVPSPARVAAFVSACRERGMRFKATAGMHHPFRHANPDTGIVEHGFVNLLTASVLSLAHHLGAAELEPMVADTDPGAFSIDAGGVRWHDHHADAAAVEAARRDLFVSYGSCSFTEPTEDLRALGLLPA